MSDAAPAGFQSAAEIGRRRVLVTLSNLCVYAGLLLWLASILGRDGWGTIDIAIFVAFAIAAPWSVLGVCNSALGFWLLHAHEAPLDAVAPFVRAGDVAVPLRSRTAMLLTIRNEDAARALARLRVMKSSVDATGEGARFDWFVLSDTTEPEATEQEEREFALWRAEEGADARRLHFRRRADNIGFKAGNIADFCARWGGEFTFMIPLDADSLMDGDTIVRLVRIGEAHPRIGIIQSLVVGAPSRSAFARIFQFGMRAGMRTYTMGAAWWGADCGPFWGHNALVRIAPFMRHCALPPLSGGRHILSHDQIEAALMRRGGYEVRVLPVECGSYEENPPALTEFMRRDLRWCRGNMQYVELLGLSGLAPMSRFQLVWAISMFIGAPAWTAIISLGALYPLVADTTDFPTASAEGLYLLFLGFFLAPKLAGYLDVALTRGELARYGGGARFLAGALIEIAASFVIGAVATSSVTLFLAALPFRRAAFWAGQARDAHLVGLRAAAATFWPQAAFGALAIGLSGILAPRLALWSAPLTLGYVAAIPFASLTASPRLGRLVTRLRLCAIPEEIDEPPILRDLRELREGRAPAPSRATSVAASA
jgi:membrane glycosyltransferase